MIKISKRVSNLEESVTLAITAKAKALKAEGRDIIGLSAGEPDFDTPENIKDAAHKAINDGRTKYTPVGGIPELKDAVIERLKLDRGLTYKRSEVLISCGGKHSIYNLLQALLDPGDEVIIPAPYWVSYPPMVELAGGVPVIITTDDASGFKVTAEAFKAHITEKTKAVIINSPSNPTGAVYSKEELTEIAELALEHDILIISDEIYDKLHYDAACKGAPTIATISEKVKAQTVVLNGVSKAYSMTGWRIGYAAGPEELIGAMMKLQSQSTSGASSISQWAAVEALAGPQEAVAIMRDEFHKRRDLMVSGLNAIDGITCLTPEGAFYVFPNISGVFGKSGGRSGTEAGEEVKITDSVSLCTYLLEAAGVAVVPGAAFGQDSNIRLSYACSTEDIKEGLARIEKAVAALKD
ncbi:Aspartate aminotransferase [hydrothermal vent metagenome]|uniref:Aspartate aminotransferase n=1 Tax=hydrothermal vent metagenome TaxID=652676 RepID=A0A3B0QPS3_9ZZZZ